jgi:hypothetical protein
VVPDGRKFLVGCFDVQAQIDKLCVMNANGRNLHVVIATPDPVNFPAWGSQYRPDGHRAGRRSIYASPPFGAD